MSLQAEGRPSTHSYLHVKCACGRDLRARPELAGSRITCWSCHASVPVPVPVAPGGWVARLLRVAARQVLDARVLTLTAVGAALVTIALSLAELGLPLGAGVRSLLPHGGIWAAGLALGLVMVGYGELLRRGCEGDWTHRSAVGLAATLWRVLLCLGAGTALVLPLLIAAEGRTPPRLTRAGSALALAASLTLPLVMLGTYFPRGSIADRFKVVAATIRRHPMAVLASLLILPASLPVIEAFLVLLTRATFKFPFLVLDLFPVRQSIIVLYRIPYYMPSEVRTTWVDIRDASDAVILGLYGDSLRQGYTLLGAIPASLALGTRTGYELISIGMSTWQYVVYRMAFTLIVVTSILSALAIQARWLGLVSTIDSRRSAA